MLCWCRPNAMYTMVYGHNPLRTKPPALFPHPDITPCGHNPQNGHARHNPLNFSSCFERYFSSTYMFPERIGPYSRIRQPAGPDGVIPHANTEHSSSVFTRVVECS